MRSTTVTSSGGRLGLISRAGLFFLQALVTACQPDTKYRYACGVLANLPDALGDQVQNAGGAGEEAAAEDEFEVDIVKDEEERDMSSLVLKGPAEPSTAERERHAFAATMRSMRHGVGIALQADEENRHIKLLITEKEMHRFRCITSS